MGQNPSRELITVEEHKADVISEVFSQGIVHACNNVKPYLAFADPQSNLCPGTDTLTEVFLVNFITFCVERGVEARISTCKMSKQQALLLGVDWLWTLSGPDKLVRLQIAVQALQMGDLGDGGASCTCGPLGASSGTCGLLGESSGTCGLRGTCNPLGASGGTRGLLGASGSTDRELRLADALYRSKGRFEKLEEFCALVGKDCLGLFIVFGLPGKPRDIRGVLLDSVRREKRAGQLPGESALKHFILSTDNFLPTRDVLETCMAKNGPRQDSKVYINFL